MSYIDMYKQRLFFNGETPKDRIEYNLARDFSQLLKSSPNKVEIVYLDQKYSCILGNKNNRSDTQNEKKVIQYLMTSLDLKLPEGATFTIKDNKTLTTHYWLILHREIHSYYGYFKYKVIELNRLIKYINDNGELKEIPVYINGSGESDLQDYFKIVNKNLVELPDKTLNLILPKNLDFKKDLRFIIEGEAWKYVDSDKISIPGVYYTTIKKTLIDESSDLTNSEIADAKKINTVKIVSNYGESPITISPETNNLQFFMIKDKKLEKSNFIYFDLDNEFIIYENGKFIPLKTGHTKILVKDRNSNFEKTFEIFITDTLENYFFTVGDLKIPTFGEGILYVNSDKKYTLSFDEKMIKVTEQNGILKIKSLNKIGNTELSFIFEDESKEVKNIEIISLWV